LLFLLGAREYPRLCIALLFLLVAAYLISWGLAKRGGRGLPVFGFFTRAFERDGFLDLGPVFLALGIALCLLYFDPTVAAFGILQICVSDGAASLAGMALGKRRIAYSPKKTYAGSLAFFLSAFFAQLPFASPALSVVSAGVGTLLESLPLGAWDNLIVPVGVSLFAFFWIHAL